MNLRQSDMTAGGFVMRRTVLAFAALSTALISSPAFAEPVVLRPSSPWNADFAEDSCRLIRVFGEGEDTHYLAFQQYWPSNELGLTIAGPAYKNFRSLDRTQVRFFDTQEQVRARPLIGTVGEFGIGVIFSSLKLTEDEPEPDAITESETGGLTLLDPSFGSKVRFVELQQGSRVVRLMTGPMSEAFKVLNDCYLDLLKGWGLDVERHLTAQSFPRWTNEAALTERIIDNYPSVALANGEQAIMRITVIVSPEGTVESCTILKSTNTAELESPACKFMRSATFEPARDANGMPFRSIHATSITYRIR